MAQIIRLRQDVPNIEVIKMVSVESVLPAVMEKPVARIVSTGTSVLPWVETLQGCLANLDVLARGLTGQPQERLQEEVRLLSARLASAVDELMRKLRDLPLPRVDEKPNPIENFGISMRRQDQIADNGAAALAFQQFPAIRSADENHQNSSEHSGIRR